MDKRIRDFEANDINAVGEIAASGFDDYSKEDFLKMGQDKNYKFVVVEKDAKIVGFLIFLQIDDKLEIIKIATKKEFFKQGIASSLLKFIIQYGQEKNFQGIILEVNQNNFEARNLYEKFNFQKIHVRKKYYNNKDDAIIMELIF